VKRRTRDRIVDGKTRTDVGGFRRLSVKTREELEVVDRAVEVLGASGDDGVGVPVCMSRDVSASESRKGQEVEREGRARQEKREEKTNR
jgi:hypothetical protein